MNTVTTSTAATRPVRAYLAVPAHRRRLVESAARSQADAVFLDLEDAVPEAEKAEALAGACQALSELNWGDKAVAVRVNAPGSRFLRGEIDTLAAQPRLDALLIPKAERPADIAAISGWLSAAETRAVRTRPLALELLIESALGLVQVEALAQSDPRVISLHLGVGDFAASICARSAEVGGSPTAYRQVVPTGANYDQAPLDLFAYPMMRLLVAARAFGLLAIDGPCGAYQDATLTRAWADKAAAMGFDGKQVIHPSQIAPTLSAFIPDTDQQAFARRVIAAMQEAERQGHGAVSVDGKMIDYVNVRMARRILALAGVV